MSAIDSLPLLGYDPLVRVVESRPLAEEPPLDNICKHKFRVDIAAVPPGQKHRSAEDIVRSIFFKKITL